VAESGGYQGRLESTRSGVVEANRRANIPVETGSRHVGQRTVDEEVPAEAFTVSNMQPWQ
jgi:hypothetical protein